MTNKEKRLRQRLEILYQQLELYRRHPEDFHTALGIKGTAEWLNRTLDEVIKKRKEIEELNR